MFDPATHDDLKHSPRLSAIKQIFEAIKSNKPARDVRAMAGKFMIGSNAVEREILPAFINKELEIRDGK